MNTSRLVMSANADIIANANIDAVDAVPSHGVGRRRFAPCPIIEILHEDIPCISSTDRIPKNIWIIWPFH
jgi:hypothetical protein